VPDIEFVIQTGDNGIPKGAPWALGRKEREQQLTLMPGASALPSTRSGAATLFS